MPKTPQPDEDTDNGAPHWGLGLRSDLRDGFAGMRKDIRQQTVAGLILALAALVMMGGLVMKSVGLQAPGFSITTLNQAEAATLPKETP